MVGWWEFAFVLGFYFVWFFVEELERFWFLVGGAGFFLFWGSIVVDGVFFFC